MGEWLAANGKARFSFLKRKPKQEKAPPDRWWEREADSEDVRASWQDHAQDGYVQRAHAYCLLLNDDRYTLANSVLST